MKYARAELVKSREGFLDKAAKSTVCKARRCNDRSELSDRVSEVQRSQQGQDEL